MVNVSIIGGSGYSGKELIGILLNHPEVKIKRLFAKSSAGKRLEEVYPVFSKRTDLVFESFDEKLIGESDLYFMALPHGESMSYVPEIIKNGKKIIDLGGDFRFEDPNIYEKWYKLPHSAKEYLKEFIYGLPELFRDEIKNKNCVANPGCYPTSAILALAPLLKNYSVSDIIINSLSGVSGAGRKAAVDYIFCEVNESVKAYRIGNHQHTPEIRAVLEKFSGKVAPVVFTPHLIPVSRGIYSTVYLKPEDKPDIEAIKKLYNDFYKNESFIRVQETVPQLQSVNGTNFCDIYIDYLEEAQKIIIISAIDNLIKGAAGQAIQNMNILFNFKEDQGLNGIRK